LRFRGASAEGACRGGDRAAGILFTT